MLATHDWLTRRLQLFSILRLRNPLPQVSTGTARSKRKVGATATVLEQDSTGGGITSMLQQFSIRLKLIAVIAFLLTAFAVTGAVAFAQMRAINAAAQEIQTSWMPSVRWLGEMRVQAARYRAVLRDYLIVAESARADVDKNLSARKADYEAARAKYEPLISSAKERELATEVEGLWRAFVKSAEDVQTLARKGDLEGAKATNANKVVPAGRAMDGVMAKMTELNDNGAEASARNARETYATSSSVMLAIFAIAMLLGLAAAIYLVRDIARGIASCLLYTSPSPRDRTRSRMPSSA